MRKAVLQAATQPPRNAPAKVRPELVETWNGLKNTPNLFQTVVLIDAARNHESFCIINLISPYFKLFSKCIIVFIPSMEMTFICVYVIIYCVGAGIATLMSISDGLDRLFFLSKDGKDAVREGKKGRKSVYFPPDSAFFPFHE